jgi:osmotically-inducible protein OsmY
MRTATAIGLIAASLTFGMASLSVRAEPETGPAAIYLTDALITARVKGELASEGLANLIRIKVATDGMGNVTLSGIAPSQKAIDRAVAISANVTGVNSVDSQIIVADENQQIFHLSPAPAANLTR